MVYFAQIIIKIDSSAMRGPDALYNGFPIFHPSIQTILKEKDPTKWYTDMLSHIQDIGDRVNTTNQFGEVPLGVAAYRGSGLVVEQLLIRPEIDVNLTGRRGRSPLYLACEEGHVYIVKLLLKHPGIDVNKANAPAGATALMTASRRGHGRVVELLLLHPNINTDKTDRDGNNAMVHARTTSIKHRLRGRDRSRSLQDIVIHSQMGRNIGNIANIANIQASVKTFLDAPISESNLPRSCLGSEVNHQSDKNENVIDEDVLADKDNQEDNGSIKCSDLKLSISDDLSSVNCDKISPVEPTIPDNQTFTADSSCYSPRMLASAPTSCYSPRMLASAPTSCCSPRMLASAPTSCCSPRMLASAPTSLSASATSLHAPLVQEMEYQHEGRTWFHRLRFHVNNSLKACCFDVNRHNRNR